MSAAPLPLTRRVLGDTWRCMLGWAAGMTAALLLYLPLFPTMNSPEFVDLLSSLPPTMISTFGFDSIASGAGYVQATFFGLIGFTLLTIAAVGWGSAAIAGAEESGRLELVLAHAVSRTQFVLETAAAILLKLVILGAYAGLLVMALNAPSETDLVIGNIWATVAAWVGLAALTATVGLLAGALTGRRLWATGAAAAVAVIGYVFNAVGNQSADLAWLHRLSPYDWAYGSAPLSNGVDGGGLALLWGAAVLLLAGAAAALTRRDVLG